MVFLSVNVQLSSSSKPERRGSAAAPGRSPQKQMELQPTNVRSSQIGITSRLQPVRQSFDLTKTRYSLLITDDDQSFRESLRGIFEPEGFQTFLAGSGEEAIDIISDRQVHLALLDQHMPRLTGLETLRIIRQMNALLPVILLTGDSTQQLVRDALSAQAFCVLSKPVTRTLVVSMVQRALARYYDSIRRELEDEHGPAATI